MTSFAPATDLFESNRPVLFGVAYRMLGSATEAEDAVQDAWLRWRTASDEAIRSPRSWLVTVVTRLCLDQLRSARVRREQYTGPWLPEPISSLQLTPGPEAAADSAETIDYAFMVMLERLGPVERAVFILHDVFGFGYDEVAEVVGRTEPACRQLIHRARTRLREPRKRFDASLEERRRLTKAFLIAAGHGDLDELLALLAEDVTLVSDGGGKVAAALNVIEGSDRVSRLVTGVVRKFGYTNARLIDVNGVPAFATGPDGDGTSVFVLACGEGRVQAVYVIRNPDKLAAIAAAGVLD